MRSNHIGVLHYTGMVIKIKFLILIIIINNLPLNAQDTTNNQISFGLEFDLTSRYTDQGVIGSNGLAGQPYAWMTYRNISISSWNNILMSDDDNGPFLQESDLIIDYEYTGKLLSVQPSINLFYFSYDESYDISCELGLECSVDFNKFSLVTMQTIDIATWAGSYFSDYGVRFVWEPQYYCSLTMYSGFGIGSPTFNEVNHGIERKWTFSTIKAEIAFEWYPFEFLYFTPHVNFSWIVNNEIKDQLEHTRDSHLLYGGITTGISF